MDSYLDIAEQILREARRPLSPQEILNSAYRCEIVPPHLHGKTQHKTLQARLSEDIVLRRDQSPFFRTAPGRFFLREFIQDPSLPEEYRVPVPTRRRVRELLRGPALAIPKSSLSLDDDQDAALLQFEDMLEILHRGRATYVDPKSHAPDEVLVWAYVAVIKNYHVLSYRHGRYRDNRDAFLNKRTLGFTTLIDQINHDLFNFDDFGITESGLNATLLDLDLVDSCVDIGERQQLINLNCFVWSPSKNGTGDILAVMNFHCPHWYEPVKRKLAMNDLRWLEASNPTNNFDDFDPWSRSILKFRSKTIEHK